jgi:hypothetical protein
MKSLPRRRPNGREATPVVAVSAENGTNLDELLATLGLAKEAATHG